MSSPNPKIEWTQKSGKECLRFTFGERLTAREAEVAIVEWRKEFQSKMGTPIILIWDCSKMKSYESEAKTKWTVALKDMKPQIDSIWLISDSPFIRLGASVMGMISSLNIKPIGTETQIVI